MANFTFQHPEVPPPLSAPILLQWLRQIHTLGLYPLVRQERRGRTYSIATAHPRAEWKNNALLHPVFPPNILSFEVLILKITNSEKGDSSFSSEC